MDHVDRVLLNRIQDEMPLAARPYAVLGRLAGTSEEEAFARVQRLREGRVIRQISAIFDTRALGYQSALVAARVAPEKADEVAAVISGHPGVSHNYLREQAYNLWFTIATPPGSALTETVDALCRLAGADSWRLFPAIRTFKIKAHFDMAGERQVTDRTSGAVMPEGENRSPLTAGDIAVIRALQDDFPPVREPYRLLAARAGMDEQALFARAAAMKRQGRLRRVAAVLNHRKAGFVANGMIAWQVPPEQAEQVGELFASYHAVTHCYLRPTYPDWPYNIFTMVHGRNRAECGEIAAMLSRASGQGRYIILYSTKEYKKTRVRYFTEELDHWEAAGAGYGGGSYNVPGTVGV